MGNRGYDRSGMKASAEVQCAQNMTRMREAGKGRRSYA
jgi:hypothetical protein